MDLAEKIGLSFQQIQKYEKGATRISVMRLQQISEALDVNITDFFGEGENGSRVSDFDSEYGKKIGMEAPQSLNKEESVLLNCFRKIRNKKIKAGILAQLRGIAELEKQKKNTS